MLTVTISNPAHYSHLLAAFAAACGTGGAYCAAVFAEIIDADGPISTWPMAIDQVRRANAVALERGALAQTFAIDEGEIRYSTREHEITIQRQDGSADWVLEIDHERSDDSDRMQAAVLALEAAGLSDHVEAWRLAPVELEVAGLSEAQLCGALVAYVGAVSPLGSGAMTVIAAHHGRGDLRGLAIDLARAAVPGFRLEFHVRSVDVAVIRRDGSVAARQYDSEDGHLFSLRLTIQPGQWDAPAVACSRLMTDGVGRDRLIAVCAEAWDATDRCVSRPLTQQQITSLLGAAAGE